MSKRSLKDRVFCDSDRWFCDRRLHRDLLAKWRSPIAIRSRKKDRRSLMLWEWTGFLIFGRHCIIGLLIPFSMPIKRLFGFLNMIELLIITFSKADRITHVRFSNTDRITHIFVLFHLFLFYFITFLINWNISSTFILKFYFAQAIDLKYFMSWFLIKSDLKQYNVTCIQFRIDRIKYWKVHEKCNPFHDRFTQKIARFWLTKWPTIEIKSNLAAHAFKIRKSHRNRVLLPVKRISYF